MANQHLRKGRLFLAFAVLVGSIVGADTVRRDFFSDPDASIVIIGSFRNAQTGAQTESTDTTVLNAESSTAAQPSAEISYLGYNEFSVPASQLSSGLLTVVDSTHPAPADSAAGLISLSDVKNDYYSLRSDDLMLSSDAAQALNLMMIDYNNATGLSDFIIYSTTQQYTGEDSLCPAAFAESYAGNTIDLAVQGANRVLEYDGKDEEAWVTENCAKYGFIVRYPEGREAVTGQNACIWHLRYVGKVHAAVMSQYSLTLDEYAGWLKSYTIDAPLTYQLDGTNYEIYYTAYMGDATPVRIPVSGNYTISGNNIDGFVIAAVK